jgi:hypothetical protein
MTTIDNSVQNTLRMYNLIEARLRWQASQPHGITVAELRQVTDIKNAERNAWQVRDCVKRLQARGYVTAEGVDKDRRYKWNLDAGPFVITDHMRRASQQQPSAVKDVLRDNVLNTVAQDVSKEVELVVAGVTIVIGKNPATGRPRIVIEG